MGQKSSHLKKNYTELVPSVPEKEKENVNINAHVDAALMQIVSSTGPEDTYLYHTRSPRSHFTIEYKLIDDSVNLVATKLDILNQVYLELELINTQDPFDAILGIELLINGVEIENYSGDSLRIYSLYGGGTIPLKYYKGKFVIPLKTCLSGKLVCTDNVQIKFAFDNSLIKSKKVYTENKVLTKSEQELMQERDRQRGQIIWSKKEKRFNVSTMDNDAVTPFEIILTGNGESMLHPVREFVVIVKTKNKVDTPVKQISLCVNNVESIYPNIFTQSVYPINKFLIDPEQQKQQESQTYFIPCDPSPLSEYSEGSLNFSRIDTSSLKLVIEPKNEYEIVLFYRVFNAIKRGHKLFVA